MAELTPMMKQYFEVKKEYKDCLLFYRLGDFYEMFFDDAIVASKVLEIALTSRDAGVKVPMCGIPYHAAKIYIQKLLERGFKIAIAEQVTEPGKGLVQREVIRVITPGTVLEDELIDSKTNNFIASILLQEIGYTLSYVDISTGESFIICGLDKKSVFDKILSLGMKEVVLLNKYDQSIVDFLEENEVSLSFSEDAKIVEVSILKNLGIHEKRAASHLLNYLVRTAKQDINHLMSFRVELKDEFMNIDYRVKKHLEIEESNSHNPKSSLIYYLDETTTSMGARRLRYYLNHPLKNVDELNKRYDLVESLLPAQNRFKLIETLKYIYDINRIVSRVAYSTLNARDLFQLKESLKQTPELKQILIDYNDKNLKKIANKIDTHDELFKYLEKTIIDEPPLAVKEGGIIKNGFNKNLDELRKIDDNGSEWLQDFEAKEREKTGIKNLKIGFNRIFGYYIEISKGNLSLVKDEWGYERKQTLANNERYITPELKEKENLILHAKEKAIALEYELFKEARDYTFKFSNSLLELANIIADIDFYLSLSISKEKNHYVRPKLVNDNVLLIKQGRHPVVEKTVNFIANDCSMKDGEIILVTGPNMSGKSTYMRMIALIVYMAQIGSFVPANEANLPVYDAIFTRIGSSDDIAGGKSTFMVEMVESNEALTHATKSSLILFDEIGRGTATYDGMALAQGMIEYIHEAIKCQTIFSTHYHELTELENKLDRLTNYHVEAIEEKNNMIFLHQVKKGPSDKSYGIQVANLAHLPKSIIKRSKEILKAYDAREKKIVLDLFNYDNLKLEEESNYVDEISYSVIEEIKTVDSDYLSPMDALILVKHLQNKIKKG